MGDKSKKIGLVIDNLELSGAEKIAVGLLRHAKGSLSVQTTGFICMDDRLGCANVAEDLVHLTPDMPNFGGFIARLKKALTAAVRLRRATSDYSALIAVTPPAAIIATLATLFTPCRVIPWVHYDMDGMERAKSTEGRGLRDYLQKILYTKIIPSFPDVIFISDASRDSFVRHIGEARPGWHVLPNILDDAPFLPAVESSTVVKARFLAQEGPPLLLFLGRIFPQKGWNDAVSMAEQLLEKGFEFNLAFVGDGLERADLIRRMKNSPAAARLHYLGPDANPLPTLECASGLILTSRHEAWPTVILEANLAKVPVFSYDCPSGPREMLAKSGAGIVTNETPEQLAEGILDYFSRSQSQKADMLARGYEFARGFLPDVVLLKWNAKLVEICKDN